MTLTSASLLSTLVDYQGGKGMFSQEICRARDNLRRRYDSGRIDYMEGSRQALELWAAGLAGYNYEDLVGDTVRFLENHMDIFYPYFGEALAFSSKTHDFYLVTANFDFAAEAVGRIFPITGFAATRLVVENGICAGRLENSLASSLAKGEAARGLLKDHSRDGSLALGDTENDIGMLKEAAHPLCVDANKHLKEAAVEFGWKVINHKDAADEIKKFLGKL